MTDALPPVPGVHVRNCPRCGARETVTVETSRPVSRGSLVEVREHDCGGCAETFRIRIPAWRDEPTVEDSSRVGEWFARRRHNATRTRVEREMALEREGRTNG